MKYRHTRLKKSTKEEDAKREPRSRSSDFEARSDVYDRLERTRKRQQLATVEENWPAIQNFLDSEAALNRIACEINDLLIIFPNETPHLKTREFRASLESVAKKHGYKILRDVGISYITWRNPEKEDK